MKVSPAVIFRSLNDPLAHDQHGRLGDLDAGNGGLLRGLQDGLLVPVVIQYYIKSILV